MNVTNLLQGSKEWLNHRRKHFNASDAPVMMGCSPYKTRTQLLYELHTGITPTIDEMTQRRFDDGHRFEALARPLAENILGEDLYPVTGTKGRYSASFDGLTIDGSTGFEHKTLNNELLAAIRGKGGSANDFLPLAYQVQMEHQCMVSGASRILFMASKWDGDALADERHCWYTADPKLRANIIASWDQFECDAALYIPPMVGPVLVAAAQDALPAVSVRLDGAIAVIDNLNVFSSALTAYIGKINKSPQTDQDFVDLKAVVTTLHTAETALNAAEQTALASIVSVNAMQSAIGTLRALAKTNRLLCDKIYKAENERRKLEIINGGRDAATAYIVSLNRRLGRPYMPSVSSDFGGAAKGLRTLSSLQDAVDTELARFKIDASRIADHISINLTTLADKTQTHGFLFADAAQLVLKDNLDLLNVIASRIAAHEQHLAVRERIKLQDVKNEAEKIKDFPVNVNPDVNAADDELSISISHINNLLFPISVTCETLLNLGISQIKNNKHGYPFYFVNDIPKIFGALIKCIKNKNELWKCNNNDKTQFVDI